MLTHPNMNAKIYYKREHTVTRNNTHQLSHLNLLTRRQNHDFLCLTVELPVFGGEYSSQGTAALLHQAFEIGFTAMCKGVLHLHPTACVLLRTYTQVLTCGDTHTFY